MNIRYKLTTQDLTTYANTKWVLNEWKETSGNGELCNRGWLHCYTSPLLAILLNPIHAQITNPKLFKCEVDGKCLTDYGLKEGWTRMRIIEEIEIPQLSEVNIIAFGILCALEVCKEEKLVEWANNWLENKDRSIESARIYRTINYSIWENYVIWAMESVIYDYNCHVASAYIANTAVTKNVTKNVTKAVTNIDLIKIANKCMEIK